MRKKAELKIKKAAAFMAAIAFVLTTGFASINASDDNISYSFKLKANYANSYTKSRYHQTSNTKNKWKINHAYSSEGRNTIATFWLAKSNSSHTRVSNTHDVHQGTGPHYYNAWSGASKTDVCLGAENNNGTSKEYSISGYWDEETD